MDPSKRIATHTPHAAVRLPYLTILYSVSKPPKAVPLSISPSLYAPEPLEKKISGTADWFATRQE